MRLTRERATPELRTPPRWVGHVEFVGGGQGYTAPPGRFHLRKHLGMPVRVEVHLFGLERGSVTMTEHGFSPRLALLDSQVNRRRPGKATHLMPAGSGTLASSNRGSDVRSDKKENRHEQH